MISFVIPAHNEEAVLGATIKSIHDSARALELEYEIIVVNDASTDSTSQIAQELKAHVVPVNYRQIAATRNAGARAATGDRFFFIDADTTANPRAIASALRAMDKGAAGGGATVWPDGNVPLYIWMIAAIYIVPAKLAGFTGGAFMFCTREAFFASGGFDERLFWAEEGSFALALKRHGRFVVVWNRVLTSGRRFRTLSGLQVLGMLLRIFLSPLKMFTQRTSVAKVWYDSNRSRDNKVPNAFWTKVSNGIALVIFFVLITGPLWNFVPRALTPAGSFIGQVRFAIAIFLCHVAMIFWPLSLVFLWHLRHRQWWSEWLKLAMLCAFCLWQAWSATPIVTWFWRKMFHGFFRGEI